MVNIFGIGMIQLVECVKPDQVYRCLSFPADQRLSNRREIISDYNPLTHNSM